MARGSMIVTLVAQTKRFSSDLRNAGKSALTFGSVLKSGFGLALGAISALAAGLFSFIPNLVRMADEARKSELRLANIAKRMDLFGENTAKVTDRVSEFAEALSFSTGIDDEVIRNSQSILLTFKNLAATADDVGGAFDRATRATIDLAAAGFGEAESNAKALGKALQDPINGLTALRKQGVTFTQKERDKIKVLTESGKLLEAQSLILDAIEQQVGGTAEATASGWDKMLQRFEAVGEELGTALLPAVDTLSQQMIDWLDSVEGKNAIKNLTEDLQDFGAWISSPEGAQAVKDFADAVIAIADAMVAVGKGLQEVYKWMKKIGDWLGTTPGRAFTNSVAGYNGGMLIPNDTAGRNDWLNINPPTSGGNPTAPGGPARAGITVNVSGITPSVTVGKTVINAIKNAKRVGIR